MHIPWTTWSTACAILPLATAFYPYHPSPAGTKSAHPRRDARDAARRSLSLPVRRVPLRSRDNQYDVLKSAEPKGSNSVAVDQDGGDISYMAAVKIGSSQEEYYLLLDSAASNTWVMGGDCTSEACGKHNTFGKGDSDSLKVCTSHLPLFFTPRIHVYLHTYPDLLNPLLHNLRHGLRLRPLRHRHPAPGVPLHTPHLRPRDECLR